jgi:hypothetical protein
VGQTAQEGYTPLIAASSAGQYDCVKLLLDHGADVNISDPVWSYPVTFGYRPCFSSSIYFSLNIMVWIHDRMV